MFECCVERNCDFSSVIFFIVGTTVTIILAGVGFVLTLKAEAAGKKSSGDLMEYKEAEREYKIRIEGLSEKVSHLEDKIEGYRNILEKHRPYFSNEKKNYLNMLCEENLLDCYYLIDERFSIDEIYLNHGIFNDDQKQKIKELTNVYNELVSSVEFLHKKIGGFSDMPEEWIEQNRED